MTDNESYIKPRSANAIEENFVKSIPEKYHRYFQKGVRYDDILENVVADMARDLAIENKLSDIIASFLRKNGSPCCDKDRNRTVECNGCNYQRIMDDDLDSVRDWVISVNKDIERYNKDAQDRAFKQTIRFKGTNQ